MALVEFTSYDDIRAALGVSEDEIVDATLSLPLYEYNLTSELEEVSLTLIADFVALPAIQSTTQRRFKEATVLFATYVVAKQLTTSLPLFSPKEISDGKAHTTRYAQDPYKATIASVLAQYEKGKARLATAYAALTAASAPTTTFRKYVSSALSSSDPVAGT